MPVATMDVTARAAASSDRKSARRVRTASGFRVRRTVMSSAMPKQPSDPTKHADHVIAVGLAGRAAERDDLAVGKERGDREDVVRRDAVLETMRAAGVLGDVAADRARGLARRIRRVVESVRCDGAAQRGVHHARLDGRREVVGIDGDDARQAIEPEEHGALGERAAGEAGAGAARHERHVGASQLAHDGDDFVARSGKDGESGLLVV